MSLKTKVNVVSFYNYQLSTVRLNVESGQVEKKCIWPESALKFRSGQVRFMYELTLSTICVSTHTQVRLAIMGKVRARAQKCESLLIY